MSKKKNKKKKYNNYLYRSKFVDSVEINKIAFHVFGSLYYSQESEKTDIINA